MSMLAVLYAHFFASIEKRTAREVSREIDLKKNCIYKSYFIYFGVADPAYHCLPLCTVVIVDDTICKSEDEGETSYIIYLLII